MAILVKRYLVQDEVAEYCIKKEEELDKQFLNAMRKIVPGQDGVTVANYPHKQSELIKWYHATLDKLYTRFVQTYNIAPSLSSTSIEKVTFDNMFGWEISFNCNIPSRCLLMQINSTNPAKFPFQKTPSCLSPLTDQEYFDLTSVMNL